MTARLRAWRSAHAGATRLPFPPPPHPRPRPHSSQWRSEGGGKGTELSEFGPSRLLSSKKFQRLATPCSRRQGGIFRWLSFLSWPLVQKEFRKFELPPPTLPSPGLMKKTFKKSVLLVVSLISHTLLESVRVCLADSFSG